MIKGPLMIEMGIHPLRAAATSSFMITFTSCSVTTSYLVFGTYFPVIDYAIPIFISSFCGSLISQLLLSKHLSKGSMISFTISAVVFLSAILLLVEAYLAIFAGSLKYGDFTSFGSLCS